MTKNQKRQRKRRISLAGGAEVEQKPTGRDRINVGKPKMAEDARREPLEARLRRGGILSAAEVNAASTALKSALQDPSPEQRMARVKALAKKVDGMRLKAAVAPDFGHDVGLCIRAILTGDEATKAWDTFSHISASHRNYMVYFVGQTGNPKCAAIAMIPEPMETDPSLRVDLRSHDEKVSAAKASWAAWEKRMKALPFPQMAWALQGALRGFLGDGTLWRDAKPTHTGRTVVAALRAMEK